MIDIVLRRKNLAAFLTAVLLVFSTSALAADDDGQDTNTRLVNAKVVEVTDGHISVIARTGVEHVIAIDDGETKVMLDEEFVSLKDLRVGDVVTVELDTLNPLKFAMSIEISAQANSQLARARRP